MFDWQPCVFDWCEFSRYVALGDQLPSAASMKAATLTRSVLVTESTKLRAPETLQRMDAALPLIGVTNAWITPPVAISVTALAFTLASFWWIQVRRGRLRVATGHVFSGAITSNKIVLYIPLVFHNPAPASLVVADIKLRLSGGTGDENSPDRKALPKRMFWIAFHGSVYPESDKHRQYAMPFAVEGRRSVERVIEFQWDTPETQLEDGPYTATVEVLVLPQRWGRRQWRTTCTFPLRTDLWSGNRNALIPRTNDPEYYEAIKDVTG